MSEKEIIIVEDLEYKEVTCADCEEPLLNLLRKSKSDKKCRLLVNCPYCGGQSWLIEMIGDYFQAPAEGLGLGSMDENNDTFILDMVKIDA